MFWLIEQVKEIAKFTDLEILASFVAASVHDFRHPGVNSNFLMNTLDVMAIRFNCISVLESMHASESLLALRRPENNFFENHSNKEFLEFHELVVQLVLATDMAKHISILGDFTAKIAACGGINWSNTADRHLALRMFIKMADLSNPTRELSIYREWTEQLLKEFFAQGDREKAEGLPISPFMDRGSCNVAKMQTTFLSMVIKPLVLSIIKIVPTATELLTNVETNIGSWKMPPSPTSKPSVL